jgi:hypothetical protein
MNMNTPRTRTLAAMAILLAILPVLSPARMEAQSPTGTPPASPKPTPGTDGPNPGPPRGLVFTVEVYALSQDDAAQVLEESGSGEARHEAVLTLMKHGKARLETLVSEAGKSGGRTVVESADEVRYAVEYNPATEMEMPLLPTAIETRHVGDTIEAEINEFPDSSACNLNMSLQRVRLLGFSYCYANTKEAPVIAQPQFQHDNLATVMTLAMGHAEFLGTLSNPPDIDEGTQKTPAEEVRLAFGKMDAVELGWSTARPDGVLSNPPGLELEFTFYSLDREAARQILSEGFQDAHCYNAVKAFADRHQAKLERVTVLKTNSGQRAVVEEINEARFPTEYGAFSSGTNAAAWKVVEPTAFETRNVGLVFEVEPTLDPTGKLVDINMVPRLEVDHGNLQTGTILDQNEPQPLFESRKITTDITARVGEQTFIGTFNPPADDGVNGRKDTGRVWFGFVRATL